MSRSRLLVLVAFAAGLGTAPQAAAQDTRELRPVPGWELPGLDITPNGGWRVRARAVAARRTQLLARRDFRALNAAATGPAGATVISGTLRVPAIMFRYQDSPAAQYARDTSQYNATLFASSPPGGKPYTLRTFYEQMSNGLFSIQGQPVGWVALTGNESAYTGALGGCSDNPYTGNCNGLFGNSFPLMQAGLAEAVTHADSFVDFGQFDNDGPDNIPNSADDDGVVDAVLFLHPSMDGACVRSSNNHLWSHRSSIFAITNDAAFGGGNIVVRDYILQSGLGSPGGGVCDSTAIMPIGTAAHELGHILALPDLYDTQGPTQGVGEWALMGSGNYTKPESPTRYDAWSLQQMGWTTVVPLTTPGTYSVGPEPTADTVFFVDVQPPNPRPEHFLIENRQAVQSDSAVIRLHGGGGLMLWHIDDVEACLITICGSNSVNADSIHGVALQEADGLRQLWCEVGCNRGDGGDPYPGTSGNTSFSFATNPAATKNSDTSFAGFAIDLIQQLVPNGAMTFRLRLGGFTTVQASDTTVTVLVDAVPYNVFRNLFDDGSSHTIAVDTPQFTPSGRTRFGWLSWSDGGAIAHTVTGALTGASYTATIAKAHRLDVAIGGSGTVSYNPPQDSAGTFVAQGTSVTLSATATPPFVFSGWTGDTTALSATLVLPMGRPYAIQANFDPQLVITSGDPRPGGIMGKPYADALQTTGGSFVKNWSIVAGQLPAGLTLTTTGGITGIPTATGSFTFTARVTSGAQQVQQQFGIAVTAPTLVTANVVNQLLKAAGTLTIDEIRYVDLLGNKSCVVVSQNCFDVGDFLAWVQATGAVPAPPAVAGKGGRP
jgi:M6 family metalloprotease-like protein